MTTGESPCPTCNRLVAGRRYEVGDDPSIPPRCLRCALTYGPLVRRSLIVAVVVGTLLIAINQGNVLLGGSFPPSLVWKIPLTYTVPYCVATFGAIMNARRDS